MDRRTDVGDLQYQDHGAASVEVAGRASTGKGSLALEGRVPRYAVVGLTLFLTAVPYADEVVFRFGFRVVGIALDLGSGAGVSTKSAKGLWGRSEKTERERQQEEGDVVLH